MKLNKSTAVIATLSAAALFGTSATSRGLSGVESSSLSIASARLLVGALGLLGVVAFAGRTRALAKLLRMPIVWLMAVGVAGYQALFFVGTGLTGVAIGTLASLALGPLFTGLLSKYVFKVKLTPTWWKSTWLAILGISLLSFEALSMKSDLNIWGILAAIGAGFCYAIYASFGANLSSKSDHSTDVLAAAFLLGAAMIAPGLLSASTGLFSSNGLALIMWLGLGATTLAYFLFGFGLQKLSAGTVATLNLAEPLVAAALGILLLAESISVTAAIGAALIAAALSLLAYSTLKEPIK